MGDGKEVISGVRGREVRAQLFKGKRYVEGGIDRFLYREKILLPILYPYIKKVQEWNPDKNVWFVDNNVGLHSKAHQSLTDIVIAIRIQQIPFWPPNSRIYAQLRTLWTISRAVLRSSIRERLAPLRCKWQGSFGYTIGSIVGMGL